MSKKHRQYAVAAAIEPPPQAPAPEAAPAVARVAPAEQLPAVLDCDRFVSFDSIRWKCACGAGGKVGRTRDGLPDTSGEVLRHKPGVSK